MIAVIDPRMPCSAKARLKEICEVVELPPFSALDSRVASHPDMLLFKLGEKLLVSKDYYREAKSEVDRIIEATALSLILTDDNFGKYYPEDIKFNAFIICDHMVGNTEHISSELKSSGIKQVNVKQGYAKCSTVVLENAVITADKGIYKAVHELGGDTLLVSENGITLDGYNCGFIGGASGVCDNKVFFCGNITKHADYDSISEFCSDHGYKVISLSDEPLYDVGTILFF